MEVLNLGSKALRRYDSSSFWDKWYAAQKDVPLEWSSQLNEDVIGRIETILEKVPPPEEGQALSICELGCGSSNFALLLKEKGYNVIGVDFSQEVINANRERYPNIRWECADALSLSSHFGPDTFDCIIGKTLLDCFLTRRDAAKAIRQLLEQIHTVLKDAGRLVFLDRTSAYHFIGRGNAEVLRIGKRGMHLHILKKPVTGPKEEDAENQQLKEENKQLELDLPALGDHLVMRSMGGTGILVVLTVDDVAAGAGLEAGDHLLGFDLKDGKGMQIGKPREMLRELREGPVRVLVERNTPDSGSPKDGLPPSPRAPTGAPSGPPSPNKTAKVSQLRSSSQTDHLRRLHRARMMQSGSLPNLKPKVDLRISEHVDAAAGLFV